MSRAIIRGAIDKVITLYIKRNKKKMVAISGNTQVVASPSSIGMYVMYTYLMFMSCSLLIHPLLYVSGFSFSPGGLLFPYHLGVITSLEYHGKLDDTVHLAGASAGKCFCK